MVAVEQDCETARRQGLMACLECIGKNQASLQAHHCLQPDLEAFCANTTCVAKLSDACGLNSADLTCEQCQKCQHEHATETGCTPGEASAFCAKACEAQVDCSLAYASHQQSTGGCFCDIWTCSDGFLQLCEGYCRIWTAACTTVILNVFCFNEAVIEFVLMDRVCILQA